MRLIRSNSVLHRAILALSAAIGVLVGPSGAQAGCGEKDGVRCYSDLNAIANVVWTGSGFTAVGQLKSAGVSSGLVLLHITRGGQLKDAPVALPLPSGVTAGDNKSTVGESRKLIALPDGGVVILGQLTLAEDKQVAWALRIGANGNVLWNRPFATDPGVVTIFHSGLYDSKSGKLILAGRRTAGFDEGKCVKWSQSVAATLRMSDGQFEAPPFYSGSQTSGANNRQAFLDIAPTDTSNSYVVAGFASAPHSSRPGECQDNILVQTLSLVSQPSSRGPIWSLSNPYRIGASDFNEMAYSIKRVVPGSYMIAGYGRDPEKGVPAAQAFRIRLAPSFSVEASVSYPFPLDGSDRDGGDRFRAIVPLGDNERFVLVGSGSNGKRGTNQAIWQTVQRELKQTSTVGLFKNQIGSDILDAAVSDSGQVLGVGKWIDDDRQVYGWAGLLAKDPGNPIADLKAGTAPLDERLPGVSTLPMSGDVYQIPESALSAAQGYFGKDLRAGAQISLGLSINTARTLKISVRPDGGDLDIALLDREKRPLAFSNFKGAATELIIAALSPGEYSLLIVGNADVRSYEIRLAPFVDRDPLTALQKLSDDERAKLARTLLDAGYSSSPEPNIGLGSETLRSLYALRQSAGDPRPISVTSLNPLVESGSSAGRR